jgi:hypothetical protein
MKEDITIEDLTQCDYCFGYFRHQMIIEVGDKNKCLKCVDARMVTSILKDIYKLLIELGVDELVKGDTNE